MNEKAYRIYYTTYVGLVIAYAVAIAWPEPCIRVGNEGLIDLYISFSAISILLVVLFLDRLIKNSPYQDKWPRHMLVVISLASLVFFGLKVTLWREGLWPWDGRVWFC